MLATNYNGFGHFGQFGQAPSLLALINQIQAPPSGYAGFGAPFTGDTRDGLGYRNFLQGGRTATYKDTENLVFCNKDNANRAQCSQNAFPPPTRARSGPIAALQQAIDQFVNKSNALGQGRVLRGPVPTGGGTTETREFTINNIDNPILNSAGYDGVVGDTTTKFGVYAITLAGMLKNTPDPGSSLAFVSPTRNDVWALFAQEVANFLNDVTANFDQLRDDFENRGNVPAQTQLDIKTIPFVVPLAAERKKFPTAIVGAAAAMIGLTTIAVVNAAKKQPHFLYGLPAGPALGRRKNKRGRKHR